MRRVLSDLVMENFPTIAKDLLNPLLEVLHVSRHACGDDMDKFLILLVIGVRTAQDQRFASLHMDALEQGEVSVLPSLGTNTRSIAESTGIPKETVRRKLTELIEAGWIARDGNDLRLTAQAWRELCGVREKLSAQAIRNWEMVSTLLLDAG